MGVASSSALEWAARSGYWYPCYSYGPLVHQRQQPEAGGVIPSWSAGARRRPRSWE